jgi:YVTN family beta-propeller protein
MLCGGPTVRRMGQPVLVKRMGPRRRIDVGPLIVPFALGVMLVLGANLLPGLSASAGARPFRPALQSTPPTAAALATDPSSPLAREVSSECGFYGSAYGPADAVYDYGTGQIFVSDSETNDVYVISPSTNTVTTTISLGPVCFNPFGLAYDPSLGEVFVAEAGNAAVAAISDVNDTVVATYPVSGQPWNIAYDSAKDALFVTDLPEGNISLISLVPGGLSETISLGIDEQPLGIAYVPGQGQVFVANSLGNHTDTLSVISDVIDEVIASVPMACSGSPGTWFELPFGVVYDPLNGDIYASCEAADGLAIISPESDTQVGNVTTNVSLTALACDPANGDVWAVAPFSSEVVDVSGDTNSVIGEGSMVGEPFEGVAIDNGTGDVYVPSWKATDVAVFSPSSTPITSIDLPQPSTSMSGTSTFNLELVGVLVAVGAVVVVIILVAVRLRETAPPLGPEQPPPDIEPPPKP